MKRNVVQILDYCPSSQHHILKDEQWNSLLPITTKTETICVSLHFQMFKRHFIYVCYFGPNWKKRIKRQMPGIYKIGPQKQDVHIMNSIRIPTRKANLFHQIPIRIPSESVRYSHNKFSNHCSNHI